jgi:hypothetical protein
MPFYSTIEDTNDLVFTPYATTTGVYTMPAVGSTVTINVDNSDVLSFGNIYILDVGYFFLIDKPTSTSIEAENLGYAGNAAVGSSQPSGDPIYNVGAKGIDGVSSVTRTTAQFTMPAVSTTVTVSVLSSTGLAVGLTVFIATAGYFSVTSIPNATSVTLSNLGYTGNAAATTTITTDKLLVISGERGLTGSVASITVGSVTTGNAGTNAIVTNSGTANAAILDFVIPRGNTGATGTAATVTVGTVTTGNAGTNVSVTNVGTTTAAILDFVIPRGDTGSVNSHNHDAAAITTGVINTARLGTGTANNTTYLRGDGTWATVSGGGGSAIAVSDEGTQLTAGVTSINFVGDGVTATNSGNAVTVTVNSGGGSIGSLGAESLTNTRTLSDEDPYYLFLNPNGDNRDVVYGQRTLPIEIQNNSNGTYALNLKETANGAVEQFLRNTGVVKIKGVRILKVNTTYQIQHIQGY